MTDVQRGAADESSLRFFWVLIALGSVSMVVAAVAGVVLAVADPREGTSPDDVFNLVAAISGLGAGALFGAAAIYAQIKNLWRFAPMWFRYLAWAILAVMFIAAILSSALQGD